MRGQPEVVVAGEVDQFGPGYDGGGPERTGVRHEVRVGHAEALGQREPLRQGGHLGQHPGHRWLRLRLFGAARQLRYRAGSGPEAVGQPGVDGAQGEVSPHQLAGQLIKVGVRGGELLPPAQGA